jgi:hypothetical protein
LTNPFNKKIPEGIWINLLPNIYSKDVLIIGTSKIDTISTVAYFQPRNLSCLGPPIDSMDYMPINYYSSIDDIPPKSYDILIVDEEKYLESHKGYLNLQRFTEQISRALRDDGLIIIFLPNKISFLTYRYWILRTLAFTRFKCLEYYYCNPSTEQPEFISPYSNMLKHQIFQLGGINTKQYFPFEKIRICFKMFLFKIAGLYNPIRGLIIIAKSNNKSPRNNEVLTEIIKTISSDQMSSEQCNNLFIVFMYKWGKQFAFLYDMSSLEMHLIIKIGFKNIYEKINIREEHENLMHLYRYNVLLKQKNIHIPTPLQFISMQERDFAVQSAVHGVPLSEMIRSYFIHGKRAFAINILDELLNVLIHLQEILTKTMSESVLIVSEELFANYLNLPGKFCRHSLSENTPQVQHGDFTAVNLYKDKRTNTWSVIDWESLALGYPPLFDLYSLFTSVRFSEPKILNFKDRMEYYYYSFIQTYFCENWFSGSLKEILDSYCRHFIIDSRYIYDYFLLYLLYECNKFRIISNNDNYKNLYERMLIYAIENKKKFIFT